MSDQMFVVFFFFKKIGTNARYVANTWFCMMILFGGRGFVWQPCGVVVSVGSV